MTKYSPDGCIARAGRIGPTDDSQEGWILMTNQELVEGIGHYRLIAVIREKSAQDAVSRAQRAIEAGVGVIEVAWTTPHADEAIRALRGSVPFLGAGTVVRAEEALMAHQAGAQFLFAPNFSDEVGRYAMENALTYIPGVYTPAEVVRAWTRGFSLLKLFPAATGGTTHLKGLRDPFPAIQWVPTGGVNWQTIHDWLDAGALAVGMGNSLFRTENLREAVAELQGTH